MWSRLNDPTDTLDFLLLVHALLDHIERDGPVPLAAADERLKELERGRRVQVRDQRRDAAEGEPVRWILLLQVRRPRVHRLQDGLVVRRLVDVRRVRIRSLRAHRLRVGVDVSNEPELLIFLVTGQDERHLLADVGGTLVRQDPENRHPFLQALCHEDADHDLLPDVRRAVDGRVRPERDAAEQQVVEPRHARLDLLLLDLDLEILQLLLEVLLLRPDLFLLLRDFRFEFLESRLQVELGRRAALRLRILDLAALGLHDLLAVQEVLLASEELLLLVRERLFHLLDIVLFDLEFFLESLQLLFPQEDHALLLLDVLLLLLEDALHLRLRLSRKRLRVRADLVLDLELVDLLFEADDLLLEGLLALEVFLLLLPQFLLEATPQLLARSTRVSRADGGLARLPRLERRLALPQRDLALLQLPLIRLHLREAGVDLLPELVVHRLDVRDLRFK